MSAARPPGALPDDPGPHRALADALRHHAERGRLPRCHNSDWPISENDEHRALVAAEWCPQCVVQLQCLGAGKAERWGIWGGVDRTPDRSTNKLTN